MSRVLTGETRAQVGNDFSAEHWTKLTKTQQIAKCREFAAEAEKLALSVNPQLREPYNEIARQWLHLADEIGELREH